MGEKRDKIVSDAKEKAVTAKQLLEQIQRAEQIRDDALESTTIEIHAYGHCSRIIDTDGQIFVNVRESIAASLENEIFLCENNLIRLFGGENYGW